MRGRLIADYHTHPQGHRLQRYSRTLLQPWIDAARARGITDLAFTDHDRFHEGIDFDELARARERQPDVHIRAGIELDNDPNTSAAGRRWIEKNWDRLDFVLGSIHYLNRRDQMFDTVPDGAEQFANRRVNDTYADYFRRVREMASSGLIDCLAHLDLVKIHGHRSEEPIDTMVEETLELVRAHHLAIELSTAGWRKPVGELYPSDEIIERAKQKGIRFTVASDAHSWAQLGDGYDRLSEKLRDLKITEICVFEKHRPQILPIVS